MTCCCETNPSYTRCYKCKAGEHYSCSDTAAYAKPVTTNDFKESLHIGSEGAMAEVETTLANQTEESDFLYSNADVPARWPPGFDRKRVWYLSGPMTGYPEYNFPAFARAANLLRQVTKIVSAHEVDHGIHTGTGSAPYDDYLKGDLIEMMQRCNGIIMLKGWTRSTGAKLEFEVASKLEWPVWFYDEYRLIEL